MIAVRCGILKETDNLRLAVRHLPHQLGIIKDPLSRMTEQLLSAAEYSVL